MQIAPEDVGRMALVRGDLSGNVLYSATIVETVSSVTGSLVNTLAKALLLLCFWGRTKLPC